MQPPAHRFARSDDLWRLQVWKNAFEEDWGPVVSDETIHKAIEDGGNAKERVEKNGKRKAVSDVGTSVKKQRHADPIYTQLSQVQV